MHKSINTTKFSSGRFGNHLIRNMFFHIIAQKNNLKFNYSHYEEMKEMGIDLFVTGSIEYPEKDIILISDSNIMDCINDKIKINKNIRVSHLTYAQKKDFVIYLKKYCETNGIFKNVIEKNKFKERYNVNNDLFVHVRMGDVPQFTPPYSYYSSVIEKIYYMNGFISSDTIDSDLCKKLIKTYNLAIIDFNEIDTILFASTCKHLVLSQGTFSWAMGFFSVNSAVYFPKIKNAWHGDIFVFPEWNEVDYKKD
jgi:hypothetical protein